MNDEPYDITPEQLDDPKWFTSFGEPGGTRSPSRVLAVRSFSGMNWPGARFGRENDLITREREREGSMPLAIGYVWHRLRVARKLARRGPWWQTPIGWLFTAWIVWRMWRER